MQSLCQIEHIHLSTCLCTVHTLVKDIRGSVQETCNSTKDMIKLKINLLHLRTASKILDNFQSFINVVLKELPWHLICQLYILCATCGLLQTVVNG